MAACLTNGNFASRNRAALYVNKRSASIFVANDAI